MLGKGQLDCVTKRRKDVKERERRSIQKDEE